MSYTTLHDYLVEGVPSLIYAAPGGLYVNIDGDTLKTLRTQRNVSLGTLANVAGVSRKAIRMYEAGMGAKVEIAVKLEKFFDEPLVRPADMFTPKTERLDELEYLKNFEKNE